MTYITQIRKIRYKALKILYYIKFLMQPDNKLLKQSADEALNQLAGEEYSSPARNRLLQINQQINNFQQCITLFKSISIDSGNILGCDRYVISFPNYLIKHPDNDIYLLQAFFESYFLLNNVDRKYHGYSKESLFKLIEYITYVKNLMNHNKIRYITWTNNQMKDIHKKFFRYEFVKDVFEELDYHIEYNDLIKFDNFCKKHNERWIVLNNYWNIYLNNSDPKYIYVKKFDAFLVKDYLIDHKLLFNELGHYLCKVTIKYLLTLLYTTNIRTNLNKNINIEFPDEIKDSILSTELSYNIDLLSDIKKQLQSSFMMNQANLWNYFLS